MKKKIKPEIKRRDHEDFIKKTEKTKLGGVGHGGVFRDKKTGKDYLIKRVADEGYSEESSKGLNWRSWDEILAARFLKHAGVLVPNMFAVENESGKVYVASGMLAGTKNCPQAVFAKLPRASKEAVYVSLMMHCWLGNRDIINTSGENYVVDSDKRVFAVDLGAAIFSGFRSLNHSVDTKNFNHRSILPFLLEPENEDFGYLMSSMYGKIEAKNKKATQQFFAEYFSDPVALRKYQLQGVLMILKFSDQDIEDLVNSTGHTPEEKAERLTALKGRKEAIIRYFENKYGKNALAEEQLALELQRIFHKQGIYNHFQQGAGSDAVVSYMSQYTNALKPDVTINDDGTVTFAATPQDGTILKVIQRVTGNQVSANLPIKVTMPLAEFKQAIHQELIENALQVFFSSYGYESGHYSYEVYKGDGANGFRPSVKVDGNGIILSVPKNVNVALIKRQMCDALDIDPQQINSVVGGLFINETTMEQFAHYLMDNTGVRKTAVISENRDGQILAGKLNLFKKGVEGYATAGGNSDRPYNAKRAAREEGADEFGHAISEDVEIIPIGSTLPNKQKNIFLVPPGGTSDEKSPIGYMEFQDGSIKYYNFSEFRMDYQKKGVKFDRSSVDLYLRHYQRQIQATLHELGIEGILVHIAKNPANLGKITLKPSIDGYHFNSGKTIPMNPKYLALMEELLGKSNCRVIKGKVSDQGVSRDGEKKTLYRDCIALNENINPAKFHGILLQSIKAESQVADPISSTIQADTSEGEKLRKMLIRRVDKYLAWRANKDGDDGRGYALGFFTKIRHYTAFGQKRAETLRNQIKGAESLDALIGLVQEHLSKDSRLNNHSLDTYLLEGIAKSHKALFGIKGKFDLKLAEKREEFRDAVMGYNSLQISAFVG